MAEVKFNKVKGIDYWLSDDIEGESGLHKYRIHINGADYYQLDLITGFQVVDHGQFDTFEGAAIKAASLEPKEEPKSLGWKFWAGAVMVISSLSWLVWTLGN